MKSLLLLALLWLQYFLISLEYHMLVKSVASYFAHFQVSCDAFTPFLLLLRFYLHLSSFMTIHNNIF